MFKYITHKILPIVAGTLAIANLSAQQQAATPVQETHSVFTNGVFLLMLCVVILLLLVIIGMVEVVKAGTMLQRLKSRDNKSDIGKIISTIVFLLIGVSLFAQAPAATTTTAAVADTPSFTYWNMGAATFYIMLSIIAFETLVIFVLFRTGMSLLDVKEMKNKLLAGKKEAGIFDSKLMKSLGGAVPIEEEAAILMDHDYDGIRELDNNLPPWWKYGFYLTIVVAVIYLLNFHVFHTGKLSAEEYKQEIKEGEQQVAEYKKTHLNMVDENNVGRLTDAQSLDIGKGIFMANCVPCHGQFGEGKVGLGPNFTDDYWIHGGSIQSVFKSIKYGWTEKGMKSWQQDLKPVEIQMVASYVKSLRGTNPPNPKEKQGELYIEEGTKPIGDSAKSDSTKTKTAVDSVKK